MPRPNGPTAARGKRRAGTVSIRAGTAAARTLSTAKQTAGSKPPGPVGRRFGPASVLVGRYTSGSPGKAVPGFDMIAGIRRKPRLCKDSGGNRAGRSGPNGLFVSSILNGVNRLFDRLRAPATRRTGPGRRRSPVSPACRHEAASWRRICHDA